VDLYRKKIICRCTCKSNHLVTTTGSICVLVLTLFIDSHPDSRSHMIVMMNYCLQKKKSRYIYCRHKMIWFTCTSTYNFFSVQIHLQNLLQLTLVISNSMGPWKKFESTVVRLKRSYENIRSVVCLTRKGRQHEQNFEELKPASHVSILGTI
jgi:hypothetical protein